MHATYTRTPFGAEAGSFGWCGLADAPSSTRLKSGIWYGVEMLVARAAATMAAAAAASATGAAEAAAVETQLAGRANTPRMSALPALLAAWD